MQYITTGNRIAVENFTIGDLYTITFESGTYINCACIGIGANFVSFQRNLPELLFTLTMETAELVSSIDLYAGGTGTNNYNELQNKPEINDVELVGNKSLSDLGIQAEITEESPLSSALVSGLGSAAAAESSDFATAAQGALAASAIQSAGSGLSKDGTTLNHSNSVPAKTSEGFAAIAYDAQGHITGSTAATTAQLAALNSGITSTDVEQIGINENNISYIERMNGKKNLCNVSATSQTISTLTFAVNADKSVTVNGSKPSSSVSLTINDSVQLPAGDYVVLDGTGASSSTLNITLFKGSSTWVGTTATGGILEFTATGSDSYYCRIYINQACDDVKFQPMIISQEAYEGGLTDYQPYAMSNAELTAAIQALQAQLNQ